MAKAIHEVFGNSSSFLRILEENMKSVIGHDVNGRVAEIDEELGTLQQELLRLANLKKDYTEVADKIFTLREQGRTFLRSRQNGMGSISGWKR